MIHVLISKTAARNEQSTKAVHRGMVTLRDFGCGVVVRKNISCAGTLFLDRLRYTGSCEARARGWLCVVEPRSCNCPSLTEDSATGMWNRLQSYK